jgi:RNase P subunit RPR2
MRMLTSPSLSPKASVTRCPQCAALARIKLVEPDLKYPHQERHVFECQECGLPRTYLIDRRKTLRLAGLLQ